VKGFLLDTNIPSEMTKPQPSALVEKWLNDVNDDDLYLSVLSIGEILRGVTRLPESKRRTSIEQWLESTLRPWFVGRILPVSLPIAERLGRMAGERDKLGRPLAIVDGLIAATALEHNLTLVTRNVKDFVSLGVTVFNPWDSRV